MSDDKEKILRVLKEIRDGEEVSLLDLSDLTPDEEATFANRDTMEALEKMLEDRGFQL